MDFCNTHPVNTVVKEPLTYKCGFSFQTADSMLMSPETFTEKMKSFKKENADDNPAPLAL